MTSTAFTINPGQRLIFSYSFSNLLEAVCVKFITIGVATRSHDGDDNPKKGLIIKQWSRHHSLLRKTMEKPKTDKASLRKLDLGSGSRLRVGKVLAPPQRPS